MHKLGESYMGLNDVVSTDGQVYSFEDACDGEGEGIGKTHGAGPVTSAKVTPAGR